MKPLTLDQVDEIVRQLQNLPHDRRWYFPVVEFKPASFWMSSSEPQESVESVIVMCIPQKWMIEGLTVDGWKIDGSPCGAWVPEVAELDLSMPFFLGLVGWRLKYNPSWRIVADLLV